MISEDGAVWIDFLASLQLGFLFTSLVLKLLKSKDKYKAGSCLCNREDRNVDKGTQSAWPEKTTVQASVSRGRFLV